MSGASAQSAWSWSQWPSWHGTTSQLRSGGGGDGGKRGGGGDGGKRGGGGGGGGGGGDGGGGGGGGGGSGLGSGSEYEQNSQH